MKKLILLITTLLFLTFSSSAQPYYFRHYQVENGLSNNSVYSILQDKDGFIWFGTKDGLNRFDGYRFKTFHINTEDESLSRDHIQSLICDSKGKIWIGTQKGLFNFDAKSEKLVPFFDSLPDVTDLMFDKSGQLWFISNLTCYRYNFVSKGLKAFPPSTYFFASSFCELNNGDIWLSTSEGTLQQYIASSDSFRGVDIFSHSPAASSKWIEKIVADDKGTIYIGTGSQGIKKFDPASGTYADLLTYNQDKTTIYVREILRTGKNEIWFGTESGVFIYNMESGQFLNLQKKYLDPYSLSDNAVYALHKDREGGIWAGTYFGGINYFPRQYSLFQKYYPDQSANSISGSAVREICEDRLGQVWIGTEDAGLNKLNPQTGEITNFKPTGEKGSIAYSNIHGLLADGNDLWVGTFEHGLDVLDIRTGKVKKHYSAGPATTDLKSNFIVSILKARNGDIYLGTSSSLYKYSREKDNFQSVAEVSDGQFVSCLLEDHEGVIWAGTYGRGIYYFNPSSKESGQLQNVPNNKNSITTNTVNALYEDSKHNLWFCTEGGGLCQLGPDRKNIRRFSTNSGLPSNFIFKILEDNKHDLWITTSKGMASLNDKHEIKWVYTKANGLLNDQFNYNSGYKTQTGTLFFGSVRGMITFKPDAFYRSPFTPKVFVTGFQVHNEELEIGKDSGLLNQSILYTDQITLPYDLSSFSIDFAAISYSAPEMTRYSYQMQGLDKEWTEIKSNRKVYFTNLAPGSYVFRLKASTDGGFNKAEKRLEIKITPPFWATGWAYLLYSAVISALLYYLVSSYHKMLENKKEKEIYEAKIEFFTNVAHEIRTPLTLIKGPVENLREMVDEVPEIKADVVTMERNTNRLVNLVNQILDFRQTETRGFSLDFSEVNITEIIRDSFLSFDQLARKKKLIYLLDLPDNDISISADSEALIKIFTNLLGNAVKYAEREVAIKLFPLEKTANTVVVEIRNDGYLIPEELKEKIFEPFYRLRATIKQKGTGIGLALARSLVELHEGRVYVKKNERDFNIFVIHLPVNQNTTKKKGQSELRRPLIIIK